MRSLRDPDCLLSEGLTAIRTQFQVPVGFAPEILSAAQGSARRSPSAHTDRTKTPFVTLDPAGSTDLDQAFAIEAAGPDLLLHYAIADIGWFAGNGDMLDRQAWERGETTYLPDGKAGLYPPILAEGAASLLPDGPRPAVIFTTRVASDGAARLEGVERALIHSRAKLAYETVRDNDLPEGFIEIARRIDTAAMARGAARIDPPEQEVACGADGHFTLRFRPQALSERRNAALSLATNMVVAGALHSAGTGLFRVMAEPDAFAVRRLRHTARAFGLDWPDEDSLDAFERILDPADPRHAAFMLAVRRAGQGAAYAPFVQGVKPWHSALAATYCHATAPLRRLADRYVVLAALAVSNGRSIPDDVQAAFQRLPAVMARSGARSAQVDRAVTDLAEAALLAGREGEAFEATVTDIGENGVRIQISEPAIVARIEAQRVSPGDGVTVRLTEADPVRRLIRFSRLS